MDVIDGDLSFAFLFLYSAGQFLKIEMVYLQKKFLRFQQKSFELKTSRKLMNEESSEPLKEDGNVINLCCGLMPTID